MVVGLQKPSSAATVFRTAAALLAAAALYTPALTGAPAEALPFLTSLQRLEVSLHGAGAAFPRLGARRLQALTINCSNTASLRTLLALAKADEVRE